MELRYSFILIILFLAFSCSDNKKGSGSSKNNDDDKKSNIQNLENVNYSTSPHYNSIYPTFHTVWSNLAPFGDIVQNSKPGNEEISPLGWKLTMEDNFEGKDLAVAKGVDEKCFTKNPTCMINWWGREECPEFSNQLKDLNKCHWDVYNYYNYMDYNAKEGEGINSFHPSNVEIKDGILILSATRSFHQTFDCKRAYKDPRIGNYDNYTINCPFFSGGMESRRARDWNTKEVIKGFAQEYGRFEVRAILPLGQGAWPAHWLLNENATHDGCGWPQSGEIDIMEANAWDHEHMIGTFHSGDCAKKTHISQGFKWKATEQFYPLLNEEDRFKTWVRDWHVYAVEWDKDHVRYLVDDVMIGQVSTGDKLTEWENPKRLENVRIPTGPFYWILNTTVVTMGDGEWGPNKDTFYRYEHKIDWVKTYRACKASDASNSCRKVAYKNLNPDCPGIRNNQGTYLGKTMCQAFPDIPISSVRCNQNGGSLHQDGKKCLFDEGYWWKTRKVAWECPIGYTKLTVGGGEKDNYPVCLGWAAWPVARSKCNEKGGQDWNNFCIFPENKWWKARPYW